MLKLTSERDHNDQKLHILISNLLTLWDIPCSPQKPHLQNQISLAPETMRKNQDKQSNTTDRCGIKPWKHRRWQLQPSQCVVPPPLGSVTYFWDVDPSLLVPSWVLVLIHNTLSILKDMLHIQRFLTHSYSSVLDLFSSNSSAWAPLQASAH